MSVSELHSGGNSLMTERISSRRVRRIDINFYCKIACRGFPLPIERCDVERVNRMIVNLILSPSTEPLVCRVWLAPEVAAEGVPPIIQVVVLTKRDNFRRCLL